MSDHGQQSVKLSTPLLEQVAELTEEWTTRDGGVVRWTRAMVLDLVMLRGLEALRQTTAGGLISPLENAPTRPPRVVKSTTPGGLEAPKGTRGRGRAGASRAAAGAGGNKSTSVSPEPTSGAATPPPPTPDPQENGAEATPARAVRAHARNEPSVEVPASAAGTPRSGTTEIPDPTHERPPPRALRVIDGGASDEPAYLPLTPEEEATIMAEAIAKQDRLRAAHQADLAAQAEKRRIAGEAWKANEARKQAELDAYYERNPNGRGVPT